MYADIFDTIPIAKALGKHLVSYVFESYSAHSSQVIFYVSLLKQPGLFITELNLFLN